MVFRRKLLSQTEELDWSLSASCAQRGQWDDSSSNDSYRYCYYGSDISCFTVDVYLNVSWRISKMLYSSIVHNHFIPNS